MYRIGRPPLVGLSLFVFVAAVAPRIARGEIVAEVAFIADTLPPGALQLNLSTGLSRSAVAAEDGTTPLSATPRLQLAAPFGERFGLTADVGLAMTNGTQSSAALDTPTISLKCALVPAKDSGETGFSLSADFLASTEEFGASEGGLNLGIIHGFHDFTLRAALGAYSAVNDWKPRVQLGTSVATKVDSWIVFGEAIANWDLSAGGGTLDVGPALKRDLGGGMSLLAAMTVGAAGDGGDLNGLIQWSMDL